jgi:5-oxopent-3-ene-1,2,5-tricarboxylate decarboxylase/2-hydroxyhepta-2,4-diene-1,7-dioate isomerase
MTAGRTAIALDFDPFTLSGNVFGTLLNHRSALAELGPAIEGPPYKAAPRAPVLYIKPRNTLAQSGDAVEIPPGMDELEVGPCLGVIVGRTACRVSAAQALDHVAGYLIMDDVSVPHDVFYRPSIRLKARDGFCPLGPAVARTAVADPDRLSLRTTVDGILVQVADTADLVRSVGQLMADVTEFMTLAPGDVLAVGVARPPPRVRAGQRVDIAIDGFGTLTNRFIAGVR